MELEAWKPENLKDQKASVPCLTLLKFSKAIKLLKAAVHQAHGFALMACPKVPAFIRGS